MTDYYLTPTKRSVMKVLRQYDGQVPVALIFAAFAPARRLTVVFVLQELREAGLVRRSSDGHYAIV